MTKPQVWFLTGSQHLYGPETLDQVAEQSAQIQGMLSASGGLSAEIVGQPVLTEAAAIRRVMLEANADPECIGVIAWMHTFSPAKMWITGLDALRKPLLHLHTQLNAALPWASIDMDFMNLNQAAHGDREFGYVADPARGAPARRSPGTRAIRSWCARIDGWVRAAAGPRPPATACALARFGDNMRDVAVTEGDKVEAELRFGVSVNTYGVNDLVARVDAVPDADVDALVAEYADSYRLAPELQRGGDRHAVAALRRPHRGRAARVPDSTGGFGAFTTNFEDLGGLRQLPGLAVQRLMADGYGFGGEGDWKTAALLAAVKAMGADGPRGTSFMEDYTYHFGPGEPKILGAHMLEVCPTIAAATAVLRDPPAGHRRPGGPGAAGVRRRTGPGRRDRHRRHGRPVPAGGQRDRGRPARRAAAEAARRPRGVEARAVAVDVGRAVAHRGRPAPHGAHAGDVAPETLRDFATMIRTELLLIDADTTPSDVRRPHPLEPGLLPARPRPA